MKKKKQIFNKGKKIRNIQIDAKIHLRILAILLILFNLFLFVCAVSMAVMLNVWYVWVLDIVLVTFCLVKSIVTYLKGVKQFGYALYENCIYLDSILYDSSIVEYQLIKNIKFKTGILDKLFGKKTYTVTLYLNDEIQTKVNLYLIKEDPDKLFEEILQHCQLSFNNLNKTEIEKK